ncbi:MAG: hypothetical protein M3Y85_08115 [Bacteroidota bacterium]|nr:hypothetical protein [Bacteroidota bacterium]
MQKSKSITLFFVAIGAALFSTAQKVEEFTSRPTGRGEYSLVLYASGGFGYYASNGGSPDYLRPVVARFNPVSTLRIMWHPDHLLKAGIETGYITFYSYKLKDSVGKEGKIALNATPILLEWSMSLKSRLNIFAGSGIYILNTKLDYAGRVNSNKLSVGWMAAASYIYPIGTQVGLGTEIKWLYAAETSNGSVCGQLQLVWRFLKW